MSKYADLNTFFTNSDAKPSPVLKDIDAIRQGLERLFTVGKGEVPFNRNYGTTLKLLLFENNLDAEDIKMFLYMDITDFEPRISLSPADIAITRVDNNSYEVKCAFTIPGLNDTKTVAKAIITNK